MKLLLGFGLLTLCACVLGEYTYLFPDAPCKWGMTLDYRSSYKQYKIKYWVFGQMVKAEGYNYNNDLVYAALRRPDFYNGATAMYDGVYCDIMHDDEIQVSTYADVFDRHGGDTIVTKHIKTGDYEGTPCMVYYDNINVTAYYVNMNGLLIAQVDNANDTVKRVDVKYTYHSGATFTGADFTFSSRRIYSCHDERVFKIPDTYYTHCAASTTTAVLSVILSTLIASLIFVF